MNRRRFLMRAGLLTAAGAVVASCGSDGGDERPAPNPSKLAGAGDWRKVRGQFALSDDYIHMNAMLIASHPRPVREAIEKYRRELDANPVPYLQAENRTRQSNALAAAADYLGASTSDIALTDSTTMGLGLVYNGLQLRESDEVLTTEQDYFVTHEALRLASERKGAGVRRISMYEDIPGVTAEALTDRVVAAVGPRTRAVALTWVHSSTGLKIPVRAIANRLAEVNAGRDEADHILLCVDGVHGFGIENVEVSDLGCDFLMAGCHKWLFGPRGTGIIWGSRRGWSRVLPTIPSFMDSGTRDAWVTDSDVTGPTTGRRMSPGGFKPFEHQWALTEAFEFHQGIGKARVEARTHELNRQLKEGLAGMSHVTLYTPRSDDLSAGIVCFDIDGMSVPAVVDRLRERRVIATVTPYATAYARLTPSIRNSPEEIEAVLREVRALA